MQKFPGIPDREFPVALVCSTWEGQQNSSRRWEARQKIRVIARIQRRKVNWSYDLIRWELAEIDGNSGELAQLVSEKYYWPNSPKPPIEYFRTTLATDCGKADEIKLGSKTEWLYEFTKGLLCLVLFQE